MVYNKASSNVMTALLKFDSFYVICWGRALQVVIGQRGKRTSEAAMMGTCFCVCGEFRGPYGRRHLCLWGIWWGKWTAFFLCSILSWSSTKAQKFWQIRLLQGLLSVLHELQSNSLSCRSCNYYYINGQISAVEMFLELRSSSWVLCG